MSFIDGIKERAKQNVKTIVLPETEDARTLEAASKVLQQKIANVILIGNKEKVLADAKAQGLDLSDVPVVDPANCDKFDTYAQTLFELRKAKGMTEEAAKDALLNNYLMFGVMMVKMGDADGMVAGACHATPDVLRPSLQVLKTAPDADLVSAFFIIDVPNCEYGANGTFLFADSGLNQDPNPQELASIAKSSAKSFELLVGKEARIAMLSHSTKGSAKHALVDKMVEATNITKEKYPELKVDGELQFDAAVVPSVGASKAPGSDVAGSANVMIFPNLDAGNIGYKIAQRLAKADAFGPVLQGVARPVNDLSRGCSADDIVGVVAITAVQASVN
ncbi:MAG: phosphate acetyltransferase [Lachnospiraceae bacterium]|jgi:phosphate acetyltransferase|nr:phosphate acetyltransferase [Lachnospiraceae bacterium]